MARVGKAETLSDTVLCLLALRPLTPDLLAPGPGVSRRTGAASSREAGPAVNTAAGLQPPLTGPPREAGRALAEEAPGLVWNVLR